MNRTPIILGTALMVTVAAVIGGILLLSSNISLPIQQTPPTSSTVPSYTSTVSVPGVPTDAAVAATLRSKIADGEPTTLYGNVVVENYALQVWGNPVGGGQALLKRDSVQGQWVLVSWGGGAWSAEGLVEQGVPQEVAASLVANVPSIPTSN